MTLDEIVGQNVRAIRRLAGLSQEELSELVADFGVTGLTQGDVSRIEHGRRSVSIEALCALSLVLHVSPLHLLVPVDEASVVTPFGEAVDVELDRSQWRDWLSGSPAMDFLGVSPPFQTGWTDDGQAVIGNPPGSQEADRIYAQATAAHRDGLLSRMGPAAPDERDALLMQLARKLVAQEDEA